MPLHKTRPWSRKPCIGNRIEAASGTVSYSPTNTDKSSQAAVMAQELASQASWADTYVPGPSATPATTATPAESVADNESQFDNSEPPPSYEDARLERALPGLPQTRQENAIKGAVVDFWRADGTPIPPLPHREYSQHETSTSISGTFTFYDSLELSTTSGSINVVIDPQPSDKIGIVRISSRSGSVRVKFTEEYMKLLAASGLLDRTYDIEIRSASGSHVHELPQGNGGTTSITSDSGSQNIKLYMARLGKNTTTTTLATESSSGSQTIKLKSFLAEPITSLTSKHRVKGSGTVTMKLPNVWEGMVHASTGGSGTVDVRGENLQFQRNGGKEVYAWRVGQDEKKGQVLEFRVDGSGSIKVDCSAS